MREVCALRHLSINTEKSYIHWLGRYGFFLKDPKLTLLTAEKKMEAFLTRLAFTGVAASTQNQAFNAILFFYRSVLKKELGPVDSLRAKRPATIRQCPTPAEVHQLLATVSDIYRYPTRLIVHILYGCGLRVSEPLNLRIKDVDLREDRLYVYQAKGNKGRVVPFPKCLRDPIERQMALAKVLAAEDHARGIPVALPGLLAKKYPSAARSERWAWLFPSHTTCYHPRTRTEVRWRCHENTSRGPSKRLLGAVTWMGSHPTIFATPMQATHSTVGPLCAICRSCWATTASKPRCSISTPKLAE